MPTHLSCFLGYQHWLCFASRIRVKAGRDLKNLSAFPFMAVVLLLFLRPLQAGDRYPISLTGSKGLHGLRNSASDPGSSRVETLNTTKGLDFWLPCGKKGKLLTGKEWLIPSGIPSLGVPDTPTSPGVPSGVNWDKGPL